MEKVFNGDDPTRPIRIYFEGEAEENLADTFAEVFGLDYQETLESLEQLVYRLKYGSPTNMSPLEEAARAYHSVVRELAPNFDLEVASDLDWYQLTHGERELIKAALARVCASGLLQLPSGLLQLPSDPVKLRADNPVTPGDRNEGYAPK